MLLKKLWSFIDPSVLVPNKQWDISGTVPFIPIIDELLYYGQWDLLSAIPGISEKKVPRIPSLFSLSASAENIVYIKYACRGAVVQDARYRRIRHSFRVLPRTGLDRVRSSFGPMNGRTYEHPVFMTPSEYGIPYPISGGWKTSDILRIIEKPIDPPDNTPIQLLLDEYLNPIYGTGPDWDRINALPGIKSIAVGSDKEDCIRFIFGRFRDMPRDFYSELKFPANGWFEPESPVPDDLVLYYKYGDFTHVGRYLGDGKVISKFGYEHIMEHDLYTVPTYYGLPRFIRKA